MQETTYEVLKGNTEVFRKSDASELTNAASRLCCAISPSIARTWPHNALPVLMTADLSHLVEWRETIDASRHGGPLPYTDRYSMFLYHLARNKPRLDQMLIVLFHLGPVRGVRLDL